MTNRTNIFLALAGGLMLGLPWSAASLFFVVFIAWVPLLQVEKESEHSTNPYAVFNYAFICCLVWNIIGTWWVIRAHWAGAIAIMVANALVQALVFWLANRIRCTLKVPFIIPFLILWLGYEHFHLSWDLAWPWLNLGNALASAPKLIQWYEYTGVRGGTLWVILANFAAYQLWQTFRARGVARTGPAALMLSGLLIAPAFGSYLMFKNFTAVGQRVDIALVQPNLDPYTEKFEPQSYARHVDDFFATAKTIVDKNTQYLFGPETLIVDQVDENNPTASRYYRDLLEFRNKYPQLNILLGIHSYRKLSGTKIPPGSRFHKEGNFHYEAFNTALFLPAGSEATPQFYHKTKLVPLFERMPFVQYLTFLGKYSLELGGYNGTYSNRQENYTFKAPEAAVSITPIVCYESIFGPYCARNLPRQKGFIAMITNDGWWKNTPGYRFHFNFSPLRAIENRRDFVRVANTGISAIIDARGMVTARTPWWEKTTLAGQIRLRKGQTFFARHGDYLGRYSLLLSVGIMLYAGLRKVIWNRRK